jgi:hypothetical protein
VSPPHDPFVEIERPADSRLLLRTADASIDGQFPCQALVAVVVDVAAAAEQAQPRRQLPRRKFRILPGKRDHLTELLSFEDSFPCPAFNDARATGAIYSQQLGEVPSGLDLAILAAAATFLLRNLMKEGLPWSETPRVLVRRREAPDDVVRRIGSQPQAS